MRAPTRSRTTIYDEIKSRIEETDISAPVRWGAWWYYERTCEGRSYPVHCRRAGRRRRPPPPASTRDGPEGEQVVLDENEHAEGHDFCSVGVLEVVPTTAGSRWASTSTATSATRHRAPARRTGAASPTERSRTSYYGFAWADDAAHFFYMRVDDAMAPVELWRHELWHRPVDDDVLVYREDDEQFRVAVGRSRDDAVIVVHVGSSMTTEVHSSPADDPTGRSTMLVAAPPRASSAASST